MYPNNEHTCRICRKRFIDERYARSTLCPECKLLSKEERNKLTISKKCEQCGIRFKTPKSQPDRGLCKSCWKIMKQEEYIRRLLDTLEFQREAQITRREKYHWKGIKDIIISNQKALKKRLENDNN